MYSVQQLKEYFQRLITESVETLGLEKLPEDVTVQLEL